MLCRFFIKNKRRYVFVDKDQVQKLKRHNWYFHHSGYAVTKIKGKFIAMHRFILNAPSDMCVDHVNRKKHDNRVANLRLCSKKENSYNCNPQKNKKYKGVHFHKHNRRWVAYIGKKPKVYLGSFATRREAAVAYNDAALRRFGVFACLNPVGK